MFRDAEQELDRLNAQLLELEEEDPSEIQPQEQPLPDALLDALLEEDEQIRDTDYKNHANQYGKIYNADKTDTSAQALGDAVLEAAESEKGIGGLLALAMVLLAAIAGILIWLMV